MTRPAHTGSRTVDATASTYVRRSVVWLLAVAAVVAVGLIAGASVIGQPPHRIVGFYVDWDPASYRSLEANVGKITTLMPEWLHLGANGRLSWDDVTARDRVASLVRTARPGLAIEPIVNDYDRASGRWDAPALARMLRQTATRRILAGEIVSTLRDNHFAGVNIDFEDLPAASRDDLVAFMRELCAQAHPLGLEVSEDVAVGSPAYDLKALARTADFLVPMMYDEHSASGGAGPVASQAWYVRTLERCLADVPASKVVIALGAYGYDWRAGSNRATSLTFPQAAALARRADVPIVLDRASLTPTFAYESGGVRHRVWMLDAVSAFDELSASSRFSPGGYAVWRLGAEDPTLWKVLAHSASLDSSVASGLNGQVSGSQRTCVYNASTRLIVSARITR